MTTPSTPNPPTQKIDLNSSSGPHLLPAAQSSRVRSLLQRLGQSLLKRSTEAREAGRTPTAHRPRT